jgi:hypothetical protein
MSKERSTNFFLNDEEKGTSSGVTSLAVKLRLLVFLTLEPFIGVMLDE